MNQNTRWAIAQGFPMRWEMEPGTTTGRMRLVATTCTYENGNTRTRVLWRTYNVIAALRLSDEITAQGGKLEGRGPSDLYARWAEVLE